MLQITRQTEYAVRGLQELARRNSDKPIQLKAIAQTCDVSEAFLAKIFQQFSKIGLVKSYRGTGGGFILGRTPDKITLLENLVNYVAIALVAAVCLLRRPLARVLAVMPAEDGAVETLGGFLNSLAGAIPARGDRFFWHEWVFTVAEADPRRVTRVRAARVKRG